jgi:hypothetical protein
MGTLVFQANLGGAVNLVGPNTASTVNFTLPSADGTNGQALVTNGTGTLSFASVTTAAGGSNTQVQYNSSGAFAGSANLTFNGTTFTHTGASNFATSTGSVGIGTTSPNTKLEAYTASSGTQGLLTLQQADNTAGNSWGIDFRRTTGSSNALRARVFAYRDGNEATGLTFSYANTGGTLTEGMRLDSSGNFGLGVTPPATSGGKLFNLNQVGAGIHATSNVDLNLVNNAYYNGGWLYGITGFSARYQLTDNLHRWFNAASGTAGNNITWTQAMTLDSSGNLLVGTTTAGAGAGFSTKLAVDASGTFGPLFKSNNAGYEALNLWNSATSGTRYQAYFRDGSGASPRGSITTDGANTAFNTSSDYRLKDNPQPLTGSGAFIDALKPKTWVWKETGIHGVGFIAHEVQEVSPSSVVGEKDGKQMQQMEYGSAEFIANIIAELQSLRVRVAQLELK